MKRHILNDERPALWVYGHKLDLFDCEDYGPRVVCNPRGYATNALILELSQVYIIEIQDITLS